MEIAARDDVVAEDQWIVRGCVQLRRDELLRKGESLADRAEHLRRAAQRVRVLDARIVLPVRLPNLTVGEQIAQQRGGVPLPAMRAGVVDAGFERVGRAADRLETHRRGGMRGAPQRPAIRDEQRREAGLRLGAVHKREAFFRLERDRF